MEIKRITDKVSVALQIFVTDIADIKKSGFRAIICNRPDGEGADQPSYAEIEKAAKKAGLEIAYVPVQPGIVTDENVKDFDTALKTLPRPLLGYCRTGTRSATLFGRCTRHTNVRCPKFLQRRSQLDMT